MSSQGRLCYLLRKIHFCQNTRTRIPGMKGFFSKSRTSESAHGKMKARTLNYEDERLLRSARELMRIRKSNVSSVASCLRTKKGAIFRGGGIGPTTGNHGDNCAVAR